MFVCDACEAKPLFLNNILLFIGTFSCLMIFIAFDTLFDSMLSIWKRWASPSI